MAWGEVKRAIATVLVVGGVLLAAAGCGSGDSDEPSASKATETEATIGGPAPAELVGTYEVALTSDDLLPNAPPELTSGSRKWRLRITNSGGIKGGRSFAIINAEEGELEDSNFGVDGSSIILDEEECADPAAAYVFYDNEYTWRLDGEQLTFRAESNSCPDRVAETILTSRPWRRVSG